MGEHWHDPGDGRVGWRTAGGGHPERSASAAELLNLAYAAAERFREYPAVLYLGANHLAYPIALFSAAQGIIEAAVLGLPDPEWGQRLVAVVVGEGDPKQIQQWVKDRLRSSKTPETIVFRSELPKTGNGQAAPPGPAVGTGTQHSG